MKSEVYWIEAPWPGKLAILPRPRGGDWLEDEVRAWREAGIDVVVSLLEAKEAADLDLAQEAELSRAAGLEYHAFPIVDRSIPTSRQSALDLLGDLTHTLAEGKNVGIHCRQGIGRSALIAASLLVLSGLDVEPAFEKIGVARGCPVPETSEQREWVRQLANSAMR
ncbi:MAG: tyrosine protein phosphatase [Blastocatellia bacterium]